MSIHGPVQTGDNVVKLHGDPETSAAPASFDDLFLDQHRRLYRALYFITGSSADAEELTQDAFLKLWERWDRIHARRSRGVPVQGRDAPTRPCW